MSEDSDDASGGILVVVQDYLMMTTMITVMSMMMKMTMMMMMMMIMIMMMMMITMMMMMTMRNRDELIAMSVLPVAIAMTMIVVNYIVSDADSIMQVNNISSLILDPESGFLIHDP